MKQDQQDREKDKNLREVFGLDKEKENDMAACKYCSGTRKIQLFTSEVDCECVKMSSPTSSAPFCETLVEGFRTAEKFNKEMHNTPVPMTIFTPKAESGGLKDMRVCTPSSRGPAPIEIRELLREIPNAGHVETLILCSNHQSGVRVMAAARQAFCGRVDRKLSSRSGLTFTNGSKLFVGNLRATSCGIRPDLLLLCLDDMHQCERRNIAQSRTAMLRHGGSMAFTDEDSLLLALGSKILTTRLPLASFLPNALPHETPRTSMPIMDSPLRQFASFNIKMAQFMGGEENEDG